MANDVAKKICDYLLSSKISIPIITVDVIQTDGVGACLRYEPSQASEKKFTDGTRLCAWNLSLYVRDKNNAARSYVKTITDFLEGKQIDDIDIEAVTLPQFVSKDDKGLYTYTATIKAIFMEE